MVYLCFVINSTPAYPHPKRKSKGGESGSFWSSRIFILDFGGNGFEFHVILSKIVTLI